jgi:RecA/RadA recombinase
MVITTATDIVPRTTIPDVAHRNDGVPLLYRGRVNTIWGPSDSGKSWFSLACVQDVVRRGGWVLIIDTEDDESGLWVRLDLLNGLSERISYIRMWARPDSRESAELLAVAARADLIVIDSLDGYLALFREADSNSATQVRAAGALMKRWAQAGNAAVLVVDHSTEKTQAGEKSTTALGSSAKKQLIDGVMLRADRETIWKPGNICRTWIMLGKDRHGHAKAHTEFKDEDSPWGRVGELVLTPGLDGSTLDILKPKSYTDAPDGLRITDDEQAAIETDVLTFLNKTPGQWQPRTKVLKAAGDKNNRSGIPGRVVDQMVADGLLEQRTSEGIGGRVNESLRLNLSGGISPSQTESQSPPYIEGGGFGDPSADNDKDNEEDE